MRWCAVVVAGVLVVVGCGSEAATDDPAASVDHAVSTEAVDTTVAAELAGSVSTVEEAAAATVDRLGDDDVATAAAFLAMDAGYGLGQLVEAGPAGRLLVDGTIVDAAGGVVAPDNAPTGLILDDVTVDDQPAGFRQIPERPLSSVMVRFQEAAEPPGKEVVYQRLFVLMGLIHRGYTLEQIMTALFTLGGLNDDFQLTDDNDAVIAPADDPYESLALTDDDYDRAFPVTTSASPSTGEPSIEEERGLDQLVERAVGIYPITPDLGVHLQGLGDVISVVPPAGEFVVAPDGTASGSFLYTIIQGADDVRLTSTWDRTLVEASLTALDDERLTFTATMDLLITWNEIDQQPYVETVTGVLEVDGGALEVTGFTELDSVRFAR